MSVFQRQEELQGWDQPMISSLQCLVLGVGGLGTNIAMNLCRLGVQKLILIDMDIVDKHNLNRQILYREEHIGQSKVFCAKEELIRHHQVRKDTIIESYHYNVLEDWFQTLSYIQTVDIIFNTIDYGDYFDLVICSMAAKYHKPIVLGGTEPFYGHTISYFLQGIQEKDVKYTDCHDLTHAKDYSSFVWEEYKDITFLPQDVHPIRGGSTVYSAGTCSHLMTSAMINYLLYIQAQKTEEETIDCENNNSSKGGDKKRSERPNPPKQVIFNLMTMESHHWFV